MRKKKLYIVFDKIPNKESGGLVAMYVRMVDLLKDTYDIEIISAFNCDKETKNQFKDNKIHIINNKNIDIRFYKTFKYIKKGNIGKALHSVSSCFYYFMKIIPTRKKIKTIIKENKRVVVSCPSAAIFMPKKTKFILEFHINYDYFYGKNLLGKMQVLLMTKPTLALFRTKHSADNAPVKYKTDYIYNFFDNKRITRSKKLVKNKILYVGRFEWQKNPLGLVELAYELKKLNNNFTLDMYGAGSMLEQTKQRIKELGLEKNVFYKGFTDDKNIYKKYSMLWLSSVIEGFPLVAIEAKANGIPTVSTNWGNAVYEVISDKEDGYVANSNKDFIIYTQKILSDEKLQKKLSDQAYKNFDKFSKEKAKTKWIDFLENYK